MALVETVDGTYPATTNSWRLEHLHLIHSLPRGLTDMARHRPSALVKQRLRAA